MRERVVEANRRFYSGRSGEYHGWRSGDEYLLSYRRMFDRHFALMRTYLRLSRPPRVLDCCAGSGLLSEQFTRQGCEVTAVDVSSEMLAICDGRAAHLVQAEVGDFLRGDEAGWDVIAFGSAVHHIWNYEEVLSLAAKRLTSGGVLFLVREPILQSTRAARGLRESELIWRKLRSNPGDVLPAIKRRLRYQGNRADIASGSESELSTDILAHYAEIHAHGLDLPRMLAAISDLDVIRIEQFRSGGPLLRVFKRLHPGYTSDNIELIAVRGV